MENAGNSTDRWSGSTEALTSFTALFINGNRVRVVLNVKAMSRPHTGEYSGQIGHINEKRSPLRKAVLSAVHPATDGLAVLKTVGLKNNVHYVHLTLHIQARPTQHSSTSCKENYSSQRIFHVCKSCASCINLALLAVDGLP